MAEDNKETEARQARRVNNPFIKKLKDFEEYKPNEDELESALWDGKNAPGGPMDQRTQKW